ncbi:hypothetical protein [Flectobacillus roseus]|uniref:hypothetical protein n=1 Tax=Flectobacillus roseus TaxID=502259 RepID=UPI0024B79FC2|nr:hypothetical protein [Flectobacillus roseus]MDI9870589.1 hypothetical protein [Flectobacillus roseus]
MSNFLKAGPPWVSNLLSIVFASLVFINTIGPEIIKYFTEINCDSCISTVNTILGAVAFLLSVFKAFSAANSQTTNSNSRSGTGAANSILILFLLSAALSSKAISQPHTQQPKIQLHYYQKIPSAESYHE